MEFNIGDRVVCVEAIYGFPCTLNKYGRIIYYDGSNYSVEFEENVDGHNCGGHGKQGHCLCARPCLLQFVSPINIKPASERKLITLQGNEVA